MQDVTEQNTTILFMRHSALRARQLLDQTCVPPGSPVDDVTLASIRKAYEILMNERSHACESHEQVPQVIHGRVAFQGDFVNCICLVL